MCDNTCELACGDVPAPAEPACDTDQLPVCASAVAPGGSFTCDGDFCASCAQAHSCDKTCGLPCGPRGGHRLLEEEEDKVSEIGPLPAPAADRRRLQAGLSKLGLATSSVHDLANEGRCGWDAFDDRLQEE